MLRVLGCQVVSRKGFTDIWALLYLEDGWALEIWDGKVGKCSMFQAEGLKYHNHIVFEDIFKSYKAGHKSKITNPLLLYPDRIAWLQQILLIFLLQ